MNVKNGCKDLKRYPQISRRVRDPLARLFYFFLKKMHRPGFWFEIQDPQEDLQLSFSHSRTGLRALGRLAPHEGGLALVQVYSYPHLLNLFCT